MALGQVLFMKIRNLVHFADFGQLVRTLDEVAVVRPLKAIAAYKWFNGRNKMLIFIEREAKEIIRLVPPFVCLSTLKVKVKCLTCSGRYLGLACPVQQKHQTHGKST